MRRLLFVCPPPEAAGGVARSAARLAGSLTGAGYEVAAATAEVDLFPNDVRIEERRFRFGVEEPLEPTGWRPLLTRAIDWWRPHVVVGFYASLWGAGAVEAAHAVGLPSVLCLRGNDIDRDLLDSVRGPRVRRAVQRATKIAAVSTAMAATVRESFDRSVYFTPNGVDRSQFFYEPQAGRAWRMQHGLPVERPLAGLFGEIKPKRGVLELYETEALEGLEVVVVGHLRAAERRRLPGRWHRVPYLDRIESLRAAYSACDVVLQPSRSDGMPNVVLEAMACARVVVAAPVGGLSDVIDHGRTGFLCGDAESWRSTLRDLSERSFVPEVGEAARRSVPTLEVERAGFEAVFRSSSPK